VCGDYQRPKRVMRIDENALGKMSQFVETLRIRVLSCYDDVDDLFDEEFERKSDDDEDDEEYEEYEDSEDEIDDLRNDAISSFRTMREKLYLGHSSQTQLIDELHEYLVASTNQFFSTMEDKKEDIDTELKSNPESVHSDFDSEEEVLPKVGFSWAELLKDAFFPKLRTLHVDLGQDFEMWHTADNMDIIISEFVQRHSKTLHTVSVHCTTSNLNLSDHKESQRERYNSTLGTSGWTIFESVSKFPSMSIDIHSHIDFSSRLIQFWNPSQIVGLSLADASKRNVVELLEHELPSLKRMELRESFSSDEEVWLRILTSRAVQSVEDFSLVILHRDVEFEVYRLFGSGQVKLPKLQKFRARLNEENRLDVCLSGIAAAAPNLRFLTLFDEFSGEMDYLQTRLGDGGVWKALTEVLIIGKYTYMGASPCREELQPTYQKLRKARIVEPVSNPGASLFLLEKLALDSIEMEKVWNWNDSDAFFVVHSKEDW
jgi:predicted nuclease of predicted toxin-antitoxin system